MKQLTIIIMVCLIILTILFFILLNRLKKSNLFKLMKQIENVSMNIQTTPRSVSGGDSIYLPLILKDFPNFNINLAKSEVENNIHNIYSYINNNNSNDINIPIRIKSFFKNMKNKSCNKCYDIKIHKTTISYYKLFKDTATIKFQTAFEYQTKNNKLNVIIIQEKYETEYTNIISDNLLCESENSLRCSHCGAPISGKERKHCNYCDNDIITSFETDWLISNINVL